MDFTTPHHAPPDDSMEIAIFITMAVALLAAYPGWILSHKAFFFARKRVLLVIMAIVATAVLAALFLVIPFWVYRGQEAEEVAFFTDFIVYGICPAGGLALFAYVADHLHETPFRAMVGGAACFAVVLLPTLYYFYADELLAQFAIVLKTAAQSGL